MSVRNLKGRLQRLERKILIGRPFAAWTDEQLYAILDRSAPPGARPAREWTDEELMAVAHEST
jgi:hypothetical protein